ncbi:MAG: hypothetical protein LBJ89_04165 [Holosporales bacterium]|nr:hypothetical protein [Holosporales bacterium]
MSKNLLLLFSCALPLSFTTLSCMQDSTVDPAALHESAQGSQPSMIVFAAPISPLHQTLTSPELPEMSRPLLSPGSGELGSGEPGFNVASPEGRQPFTYNGRTIYLSPDIFSYMELFQEFYDIQSMSPTHYPTRQEFKHDGCCCCAGFTYGVFVGFGLTFYFLV